MMAIPTVIVVRHGRTDLNKPNQMRGWTNVALNKAGIREAKETAYEINEEWTVKKIYTSDLKRAIQSAEPLEKLSEVEVVRTKALRPWDGGELVGKHIPDLQSKLRFYIENQTKAPKGGESMESFIARLLPFVSSTLDEAEAGTSPIALVTSIRPIEVILGWIDNGMSENIDKDRLEAKKDTVGPSGVVVLRYLKKRWTSSIWKEATPVKQEGKS